jgi:hypothetical protein
MATFSKVLLSGGTTGMNIKVAATSSAGTTIHTAVSGTSNMDEVWLYACNTSGADVKLTIEYGAIRENGLVIKAFAASANVININGYANRITA